MSRCLGAALPWTSLLFPFLKLTDTWGRGLVLWVKSYGMRRWKFATGQRLPSNLDPSLLLLPFSLIITSCFAVTSQVGRNIRGGINRALCTTRPQWPPAAFHSPCALKSHHHHPVWGNLLPLYPSPFKLLTTTLQSHNAFSSFKSRYFLFQVLG